MTRSLISVLPPRLARCTRIMKITAIPTRTKASNLRVTAVAEMLTQLWESPHRLKPQSSFIDFAKRLPKKRLGSWSLPFPFLQSWPLSLQKSHPWDLLIS